MLCYLKKWPMSRLEKLLLYLAQQYLPQLIPDLPPDPRVWTRLIADALASEVGILVLRGDYPRSHMGDVRGTVEHWAQPYAYTYTLLARSLYPSKQGVYWSVSDRLLPPFLIFTGELEVLVAGLGRYVVPYVAERQRNPQPQYMAELRGMCSYLIDAVGGDDLPQAHYRQLRDALMAQVSQLIQQPIRQRGLTTPADDLFTQTPATPMPRIRANGPATLPETPSQKLRAQQVQATAAPNELITDSQALTGPHGYPRDIPIFFNGRRPKRKSPPVMPPPGIKHGEDAD